MASSSTGVGKERRQMSGRRIPAALRTALGDEGTFGLIELLDSEQKDWSEKMLTTASDRFETRLTQQVGGLRQELHDGLSAIRAELATVRVEMLRWSFAFWIGQVAAVGALMALMLRAAGR
jgi:hypothetical protein